VDIAGESRLQKWGKDLDRRLACELALLPKALSAASHARFPGAIDPSFQPSGACRCKAQCLPNEGRLPWSAASQPEQHTIGRLSGRQGAGMPRASTEGMSL